MRELTEKENEILNKSAELYNMIIELPIVHINDNAETCRDIHNIQNRIISRCYK